MVYTSEEYCKVYKFGGKFVSSRTIERRCIIGALPKGHTARKLAGRRGAWIIEVSDSIINENIKQNYSLQIKVK